MSAPAAGPKGGKPPVNAQKQTPTSSPAPTRPAAGAASPSPTQAKPVAAQRTEPAVKSEKAPVAASRAKQAPATPGGLPPANKPASAPSAQNASSTSSAQPESSKIKSDEPAAQAKEASAKTVTPKQENKPGATAGAKPVTPRASAPGTAAGTSDPAAAPMAATIPKPAAGTTQPATVAGSKDTAAPAKPAAESSRTPGAPENGRLNPDGTTERFVASPKDPAAPSAVTTKEPEATSSAPAGEPQEKPMDQTPEATSSATGPAPRTGGLMMALMIVSFVLEVALMGALGIWGLTMLSLSPAVAVLLAVLPVLIFWGIFMSPKAKLRLPQPYHAVVAHVLFAGGAILLAIAGQPVLAVCMGGLTAISLALTAAVRGQNVEDRKKSTGRRAAR